MLKKFILFFLFLSSLFSKDLLIVDTSNYCVSGFNLSSFVSNSQVYQNISFVYYLDGVTLTESTINAVDSVFDYSNVQLFLDVGEDCSIDLTNKEDAMPKILNDLKTNITGDNVIKTGFYNDDNTVTIQSVFPSSFPVLIETNLTDNELNLLYGLSGIITATFLLLRIS